MGLLEGVKGAPIAWHGDLPVTSRYTAGLAGERFFRALKDEGRILGSHCPRCDVTYVPGRVFCERCLAELDDWVDVGLIGEVHTFTLLFENLDGSHRAEPIAVAFVALGDGGIVHTLGDVAPEDVYIGMTVEAVLKPPAERVGGIHDIACFRPVG
jgi:uncharacterized protein